MPITDREKVKEIIKNLLEANIFKDSKSPFTLPNLLTKQVKKAKNG